MLNYFLIKKNKVSLKCPTFWYITQQNLRPLNSIISWLSTNIQKFFKYPNMYKIYAHTSNIEGLWLKFISLWFNEMNIIIFWLNEMNIIVFDLMEWILFLFQCFSLKAITAWKI